MRPCQVRNIRDNHPELWIKLLELEKEENLIGNIWNTLKKISVWELEEQYFWEEAQMTIYDYLGGGSSEEKESMEAPEGKREAADIDRATAAGVFE